LKGTRGNGDLSSDSWLAPEDLLTRCFAQLAGPPAGELVVGIGHDCAVLRPAGGEDLVWSVDSQEEGLDFRREWSTAEEIGARAVAVALSDVAAAGGRPLAVLLSLASGEPDPADELQRLFEGALGQVTRWGGRLAGGDLSRRQTGISVTVSVLGAVPRGAAVLRSGALAGDELWVTGIPGLAATGRRVLEKLGRPAAERDYRPAVERFLRPEPRLEQASWLRERVSVHAALDLSDGLGRDLPRLCAASGVGARLDVAALTTLVRGSEGLDLDDALYGGDDYELLLAVPAGSVAGLAGEFSGAFGLQLTRVGEILREPALILSGPDGDRPLVPAGWDNVAPVR
jgi:thiamine-monophosphate kinase